jgi:polyisoprenoid-binding protein YceI
MRTRHLISTLLAAAAVVSLAAAATRWSMQPRQSTLSFLATQAGAPFEGTFDKFTADIQFDPADLAGSRFDVKIDLSTVNTRDRERDDTLKGPDLFAVERWPTSRYVAERFTARGGARYSASGKLSLRDVTREVPLEFTFEKTEGGAWLKGSARLNRLDFGVGQGEWRDTETVANEVQIRFVLLLKQ